MIPQQYDTIVIGGGVGGLSAACYEAKKSKTVLLLEKNQSVGGKAAPEHIAGLTVDPGPSIIVLKWIYEKYFRDMGYEAGEYIDFDPLNTIMSLEHGGQVWDIPSGVENFLGYIESHFSQDLKGFEWLIGACTKLYPKVKSTIYQRPYTSLRDSLVLPTSLHPQALQLLLPFGYLVESKFSHPAIKGLLYDYLTYSGHTPNQPSTTAWFTLFTMIYEGVYYPRGGIHKIPYALSQVATSLGVDIKTNHSVKKITRSTTDLTYSVITEDGCFRCNNIISNVDPIVTNSLLGKPAKKAKPSFSYATLTYAYTETPDASHHTLHIPLSYKQSYDNLFNHRQTREDKYVYYLNHPHISDELTDPYLFVVAPMSTITPQDGWETLLHSLDEQVRINFQRQSNLDLKLIDSKSPLNFATRDSNPDGSLFGSGYSLFTLLPQPLNTNQEGIIHVGGAVQPGAGLPMVLLSGKFASEYIKR